MIHTFVQFVRAVALNRVGLAGVVLTSSAVGLFVLFEAASLVGLFANAYAGLVTYLAFPAMFCLGLILIPIGWRRRKQQTGKSTRELLEERFSGTEVREGFFGSRVFRTVGVLTVANVAILGVASSRMLHFMDEPHFCGTACHSVMSPEWVTYQASPHARVKCVECHVGEGVGALIDSKINGTWQMISVTFDLLERPIPTPVHQLRPARETCEKCHWPDKFYGSRLRTFVTYASDSVSTPTYTSLNMKIDAGRHGLREGIHWHVAAENEIRYASVADEREEMLWVEVRQPDGSYRRYTNTGLSSEAEHEEVRVLDCVDCHNRATHVYEDPVRAVDERMNLGMLDRSLPFLKRESVDALTSGYADSAMAMAGIAAHLEGFYQRYYPEVMSSRQRGIDSAVAALQGVYNRNVHHGMNITWGAYSSHIGHRGQRQGCFRCHNESMVDSAGLAVRSDCTLCHSILANRSTRPLEYLQADTAAPEYLMHDYLRAEFFEFMGK